MIKFLEAIDDIVELPYSSDEDIEQGLTTADPEVILQTISNLAPGEYVIIQNTSPAKSALAEYYCRKEFGYASAATAKASLRRNQGR